MARRRLLVLAASAALLSACADDSAAPSSGDNATPASSAPASHPPATTPEQLFATIDQALARETSVRQETGKPGTEPTVVLHQEYGGGSDLLWEFLIEMDGRSATLAIARVDGDYFGRDFESDVWEKAPAEAALSADDTQLFPVAAQSDVREDFQRMAALAGKAEYVGEDDVAGQASYHYRLPLRLAAMKNPAFLPAMAKGVTPADLWVSRTGLPLRVDVPYGKQLIGTLDSGVSRTTYSEWSEPVEPHVN